MYNSILRRTDIDALQLIFGGHFALHELADLRIDFAQLLADLAAEIKIDLNDLQFDLRDLAAGLGRACHRLRPFAFKASCFALQQGELGYWKQVFSPKNSRA